MQQPRSQASEPSANEGGEAPLGWDLPTAAVHRHNETNAPSKQPTLLGEDASMPVFTSREEEIEFASQPTEEIVAAEADVLGVTEDMAKVDLGDDVGFALIQLEAELALIPDTAKGAYMEATRRCPAQVDEEQKKAFLFREEYNAKLAAKRLAKYWEKRHALFGEEQCYLPFTLEGALSDDTAALQHCVLRVLPDKDKKERVIALWSFENVLDKHLCSKESMLRACWYTLHVASKDTKVRQGRFVILFRPVSSQLPDRSYGELFMFHAKLLRDFFALEADFLPFVFRGLHWCKPNRRFHLVGPVLKYMLGKRLRGRLKVHYGTDEEVLKGLEEYGMPRKRLPSELGGDAVICHDQWLADRKREECGIDSVSTTSAGTPDLVQPLSPGRILCNDSWEPISMKTQHTAMFDKKEGNIMVRPELTSFKMLPDRMGGEAFFKDTEQWMFDRMQSEEPGTSHVDSGTGEGGPEAAVFSSVFGANGSLSAAYDSITLAATQGSDSPANDWVPKLAQAEEERHLKRMQRRHQQDEEHSQPRYPALTKSQIHSAEVACLFGIEPSSKCGRKVDPRMDRAVEVKMNDPNVTLLEALEKGGFVFPDVGQGMMTSKEYLDADGVSLYQRKNQLNRRIRNEKQRIKS